MGRHRALTIETYREIKEKLATGKSLRKLANLAARKGQWALANNYCKLAADKSQGALAKQHGLSKSTLFQINSGAWLRGYEKEQTELERKAGLPDLPKLRSKGKPTWCHPCGKNVRKPCVACRARAYAASHAQRRFSDGTLVSKQQQRPDGSVAEVVESLEDDLNLQLSAEQRDRLAHIRCRAAFRLPTVEGT